MPELMECSIGWQDVLADGDKLKDISWPLVSNFNHYQRYSRPDCMLRWATLRRKGALIGAVPVVQFPRCPVPSLLNDDWRRKLRWLSPLLRRNIVLVDTSFLGYMPVSPFLGSAGDPALSVKRQLCEFIWRELAPGCLIVTEPAEQADLGRFRGWDQYSTLPIALIDLAHITSFDHYAHSISQKRRRNLRKQQAAFRAVAGHLEMIEGPLDRDSDIFQALMKCLKASEARARIYAPYNTVMINEQAFAGQRQTFLVARIGGRVAGFISWIKDGDSCRQTHGGLDYQQSQAGCVYHNLIYGLIEEAISRGCTTISMGPLNNETKRRSSSRLLPMVNSVRQRSCLDRLLSRVWLYRRLGVYGGSVQDAGMLTIDP